MVVLNIMSDLLFKLLILPNIIFKFASFNNKTYFSAQPNMWSSKLMTIWYRGCSLDCSGICLWCRTLSRRRKLKQWWCRLLELYPCTWWCCSWPWLKLCLFLILLLLPLWLRLVSLWILWNTLICSIRKSGVFGKISFLSLGSLPFHK